MSIAVETAQVLLHTEQQLPIHPSAIAATNDGLIVAGSTNARAWATKTDNSGKVLWTYLTDKPDWHDRYPWPPILPQFRCTAAIPDGSVLFGSFITTKAGDQRRITRSMVLITLSDDMCEVLRQDAHTAMISNVSYRLPDQSLMMFGAAMHTIGERYSSQVAHLDSGLQRTQALDVRRDTFSDNGMIYAAAPLNSTGRFATATVAVVKGYPDHPVQIAASTGFLRGLALEFLQLR